MTLDYHDPRRHSAVSIQPTGWACPNCNAWVRVGGNHSCIPLAHLAEGLANALRALIAEPGDGTFKDEARKALADWERRGE